MRRELVDRIAPPVYAAIDFVVVLAPALAVKLASDRGGMGDTEGLDLIAASAMLGTIHAVFAWSRLRTEERVAVRRADMWIAAVDALVVLALGATVLPIAVLYGFADEHASIADQGFPVVALWAGIQIIAIALAEATGRFVFWWLEPHGSRTVDEPRRQHTDVSALGAPEVVAQRDHLVRGRSSEVPSTERSTRSL